MNPIENTAASIDGATIPSMGIKNFLVLGFFKLVAKGLIPARWFEPVFPPEENRSARAGPLKLEIVSHCWT
jgi:hypothetical protein